MRPADGVMMKLVKYSLAGDGAPAEASTATIFHNHSIDKTNEGAAG